MTTSPVADAFAALATTGDGGSEEAIRTLRHWLEGRAITSVRDRIMAVLVAQQVIVDLQARFVVEFQSPAELEQWLSVRLLQTVALFTGAMAPVVGPAVVEPPPPERLWTGALALTPLLALARRRPSLRMLGGAAAASGVLAALAAVVVIATISYGSISPLSPAALSPHLPVSSVFAIPPGVSASHHSAASSGGGSSALVSRGRGRRASTPTVIPMARATTPPPPASGPPTSLLLFQLPMAVPSLAGLQVEISPGVLSPLPPAGVTPPAPPSPPPPPPAKSPSGPAASPAPRDLVSPSPPAPPPPPGGSTGHRPAPTPSPPGNSAPGPRHGPGGPVPQASPGALGKWHGAGATGAGRLL